MKSQSWGKLTFFYQESPKYLQIIKQFTWCFSIQLSIKFYKHRLMPVFLAVSWRKGSFPFSFYYPSIIFSKKHLYQFSSFVQKTPNVTSLRSEIFLPKRSNAVLRVHLGRKRKAGVIFCLVSKHLKEQHILKTVQLVLLNCKVALFFRVIKLKPNHIEIKTICVRLMAKQFERKKT